MLEVTESMFIIMTDIGGVIMIIAVQNVYGAYNIVKSSSFDLETVSVLILGL